MIVPLIILAAALLTAAATTYGTSPYLAQFHHGIECIMLARRLEWPLVALAIVACLAVIAMVVAGKWRAWWLLGLAPVLTLFAHRASVDPARAMKVTDDAAFVSADKASFVADDDFVVGLTFGGEAYAYPYGFLYGSPVVVQAEREERLVLFWSAFANRAVAAPVDRTVKPRELEIVSVPANALLVYNGRLGQFINGVTGLTMDGRRPTGFGPAVATAKMEWKVWRTLHPQTKVMSPPAGFAAGAPTRPLLPYYPMPGTGGAPLPTGATVALVETSKPAIVDESAVGRAPLNLIVGGEPVLMFRDAAGATRAFLRQANGDLTPRFFPLSANHAAGAAFTERDSNSLWAADGRAIDGPLKGEKLKPFEVDDDVYLDVIRFWYPGLTTIIPTTADVGVAPAPARPVLIVAHGHTRTGRRRKS